MARDTQRKPFSVFRSDAIDENERILEAGRQQRQENRERKEKGEAAPSIAPASSTEASVVETKTAATIMPVAETLTTTTPTAETSATTTSMTDQPATTSFSNDMPMSMHKSKSKKTENGITIYVPMKYYERIALMKMRTGVPIKDLALQAVIEFLDRNKTR